MSSHPPVHIDTAIMERLRPFCLDLPEAVETEAFGAPSFRVRKKIFAMLSLENGRPGIWCKTLPEEQQALIETDPERYYAPPYLGPKGWVAAWLDEDAGPDWDEIEDLVIESYRRIAPKTLVKALDNYVCWRLS